jgi:hypothetical protein
MQYGSQFSGPDNMQQSPAVLCTEMIPPHSEMAEAKSATTAQVYETLFGCPPQFTTIADVVPERQGTSRGHFESPHEVERMQATPSSLLAFSAQTMKSDVPVAKDSQVRDNCSI